MNGVSFGTPLADTYNYTNTENLLVANETTLSSNAAFGGYMYYFHFIKGVAKYTANFTPEEVEPSKGFLTITPATGKQIFPWTAGTNHSIILYQKGQTVEMDRDSGGNWWGRMLAGETPVELAD